MVRIENERWFEKKKQIGVLTRAMPVLLLTCCCPPVPPGNPPFVPNIKLLVYRVK